MTDNSDKIKKIHLKIWLAKSPENRLHQTLKNNDELNNFWNNMKLQNKSQIMRKTQN